ncbi:MAG: extracellular solute-binding protein, partial [Bifidobacteriaceae bacterium]|nr:extracellular solute-binding protein [Bifidobacteriaceae bacterium]
MKSKARFPKLATALVVTGALAVAGCGSNGDSPGGDPSATGGAETTLVFWHYESDEAAMTQSWNKAIEEFEKTHQGVTIKVEKQTFEQLQKNAKIVLTGSDVPDIMEYNKGNGTAGQLAAQGLLTDLTAKAAEFGWDTKLSASLQTTARYDENGLMGSGNWYGAPTYGEYVTVYYNQDMFEANSIAVPTTLAELEAAMDAFLQAGITPLAEAGAEYPLMQLWYELVLAEADRAFIDSYQLFDGDVDFTAGPMLAGTEKLADWVAKGYVSSDASGLTAEDMGTAFIAGTYPMMFSGSWWFGRLNTETPFKLGQFLFPGSSFSPGSSGNLLVVPSKAKNADLAAEFIDVALGIEAQNVMAELGGLPVAGDASVITDEATKVLQQNWDALNAADGLAYYPDWPVAGFYDTLVGFGQSIANGSKTPAAALGEIGAVYSAGRADLLGG